MPQPPERLLTEASGLPLEACARLALAQETLQRFGRLTFRATGSSMLPAIAPGDILSFHTPRPDELIPGRVVLFGDGERLVAHRMLTLGHPMITTMGDALRRPDAAVPHERVIGVLDGQQRDGRSIPLADPRRLLPSASRWAMRHLPLVHRIARRWPRLAVLTA